jgi:imidazolonepropionase-like amidohydrolase
MVKMRLRNLSLLALGMTILTSFRCVSRTSGGRANPQLIVIVDVSVIPIDREVVIPGQTVVIQNGLISYIGPKSGATIPPRALKLNGEHLYVMPGLTDMHAHLSSNPELSRRFLSLFVATGVTTILNMRGEPSHLELRKQVAEGKIVGPRIYTTGPFLGDPYRGQLTTTPQEVVARVAEDKAAGYDFIKLHGDLSRASFDELMADSKKDGIRVIGHLARNLSIYPALQEHQYAIAHGEEYLYAYFYFHRTDGDSDSPIPNLTSKTAEIARETAAARVTVIPNLVLFKEIATEEVDVRSLLRRPEMRYMPKEIYDNEWIPEKNVYVHRFQGRTYCQRRYPILQHLTKALQDAGVRLLVGTDTPAPCLVPGFSVRLELEDLVEAGLTPYQALRAATLNAGEFLGVASGKVAVGQRADLLLLHANPLTDIRNVSQLEGVILNGQWLPHEKLQGMLDDQATVAPN